MWKVAFFCVALFSGYSALREPRATATVCAGGFPSILGWSPGSGASITFVWSAFALWSAAVLIVVGLIVAARIRVCRWPSTPFELCHESAHVLREAPTGVQVRIADGKRPEVPITWGFVRPVILLPSDAAAWEATRLRAALLHEVGHIRRFDNLAQLFALFVCALHRRLNRRMSGDAA